MLYPIQTSANTLTTLFSSKLDAYCVGRKKFRIRFSSGSRPTPSVKQILSCRQNFSSTVSMQACTVNSAVPLSSPARTTYRSARQPKCVMQASGLQQTSTRRCGQVLKAKILTLCKRCLQVVSDHAGLPDSCWWLFLRCWLLLHLQGTQIRPKQRKLLASSVHSCRLYCFLCHYPNWFWSEK